MREESSTVALAEPSVLRRTDGAYVLRRLLPLSREAASELHALSSRFSAAGWKDLFIRFWQIEAQAVSTLEWKLRDLGEVSEKDANHQAPPTNDAEEEIHDPYLSDKMLLLRCIQQYSRMLPVYTEIRRLPLPFDIRMMLQRHQLQTREVLGRLNALYSTYFQEPGHTVDRSMQTPLARQMEV